MARKRIKQKEVNLIEEQDKKESLENVSSKVNSIGYQGHIKVSVLKKDKLISTRKFNNSGRYPLFQFITDCLAGNYKNAEIHRPYCLALFTIGGETDNLESDSLKWSEIKDNIKTSDNKIGYYAQSKNKVTYGDLFLKTVPKVEVKSGIIGNASITYTFNIPFSHIYTESKTGINLVCLYDRENRRNYDNPSAFFFVMNDDGTRVTSLVDTELLTDNSAVNYNLIIEWTLDISNKEEGDFQ